MSLVSKIKNRTAWTIRKTKKYSNQIFQRFFGIEEKDAQTNILPDSIYLKKLYKARMGKELDLKHPKTFNEKLQWLKLHDRKPIYTTMVDKYAVKKYVADIIGEEYIIPTLGVWDSFDDIDFKNLPNKFVLKCTHDSGGVYICKDKTTLNIDSLRVFFKERMSRNYYKRGREWPYKNVKPRIIAEKYIDTLSEGGIIDYKFFCFNGKPIVFQLIQDRPSFSVDYYDCEFKHIPITKYHHYLNSKKENVKPENFEKMVKIAEELAKDRTFVRVDLYNIESAIHFGEYTFYPGSGLQAFDPEEWDRKLGDMIHLPCDKK